MCEHYDLENCSCYTNIADDDFNNNFPQILEEENKSQVHRCHLCVQEFGSLSRYSSHLKNHGNQTGKLTCSLCNDSAIYETSWRLWQHIRKSHISVYQDFYKTGFNCTICDKGFKHPLNYHLHMLIHLGEQPERCRFCCKTFRTKPSLRKHELVHTGEKSHECPSCDSAFKTKDELKQHSIAHLTVKSFQCSYCDIKFKYQASMKRHEKKGRCKIGKHWCPLVKRKKSPSVVQKQREFCDLFQFEEERQQPMLFSDVFLGVQQQDSLIETF